MKKGILAVVAVALVCVGFWNLERGAPPVGAVQGAAAGPDAGGSVGRPKDDPAARDAEGLFPPVAAPLLASTSMSAGSLLVHLHGGLWALDAKEAAWLRLNGYPTPDELENLVGLDWALIESRRTDPVALVLLGERAAKAGRLDEAKSLFSASSARGSLYGAMRAGQMYSLEAQKNDGDPSDWILGMTPALVARGLGDHQAGAWIERSIPAQARMDPSISERAAFSALDEIARRGQWAVEAGRGGLLITPRPNARRCEEMAQRPDLPVNVVTLQSPYRRGP